MGERDSLALACADGMSRESIDAPLSNLGVLFGATGATVGSIGAGALEEAVGIANTMTAIGLFEAFTVVAAIVAIWPWRHLKSLETPKQRSDDAGGDEGGVS